MGVGIILALMAGAGGLFLRRPHHGKGLQWVGIGLLIMTLLFIGFAVRIEIQGEHMEGH
ncbi:hypothetical protein J2T17_003144 [Paenibacillus mucilaginosus]|uniref:hypothetical protein n=1 Tax=Paenibacillus mucilaginosus TaxID=61624 RepID=UPI003D1D380C